MLLAGERWVESGKNAQPSKTHPPPAGPSIQTWKLAVELTALEIVAGHDGLLRGAPEPVILLAAFHFPAQRSAGAPGAGLPAVTASLLRPIGRELIRFAPSGRFPLTVPPTARTILRGRIRGTDRDRIVIVAIALEEDGGDDIVRVYGRLLEAARLRVWDESASEPLPRSLGEIADLPPAIPPFVARVHVLDDGADLRDACKDDKMIGAGVFAIAPHRCEDAYRARFVSADQRNDWTAVLAVSIG